MGGRVIRSRGPVAPLGWSLGVAKDWGHPPRCLPAREPEAAVLEQLPGILRSGPTVVARAVDLYPTLDEAQVNGRHDRLDAVSDQLFPAEQRGIVGPGRKGDRLPQYTEVRLRQPGIARLVLELGPDPAEGIERSWHDPDAHRRDRRDGSHLGQPRPDDYLGAHPDAAAPNASGPFGPIMLFLGAPRVGRSRRWVR